MLDPPTRPLSPRELEIVELVAKGYTDREIAKALGLTRKAVSNRLSEWIFPKLAVTNRVGAARWYLHDYSDQVYKYPDSYLVELRRLGLDREPATRRIGNQPQEVIFELSDHMGSWCAWCARYFNPHDAIGVYRPYRPDDMLSFSKDIVFPELELERVFGWAVPVHRGSCPLGREQPNAPLAAVPLDFFFRCGPHALQNLANTTYLRGNLVTNVAISLILRHQCLNEGNEHDAASELAKATIANAASITSAGIGQLLRSHMPNNVHAMTYLWIHVLMGLGNLVRNLGYPDRAEKRCYGQARWNIDKIRGRNSRVRAVRALDALERREMTVAKHLGSNDVERVVDNARDHNDPRGLLTAYHNVGWHYFRDGDYRTAEKNFSIIVLEGQKPNAIDSWWHKMTAWLGLGATLYVSDQSKYDKALGYCLMAEYVSAILGLRVDVTRGISEQLLGPGTLLSPSSVVRRIVKESNFDKEKVEEIRRTALIESGLQKELLAELSGASWALK